MNRSTRIRQRPGRRCSAADLSERVMNKWRTCRDCFGSYRYSPTHIHSRYCPECLPNHPRRCTTCQVLFHPEQDSDQLCPI
ncbi:MAG: hypothetical protein M3308_01265, partial [Actinomycetota bacterium]|nr:hypothetical protein [Actinomycetota bacterium]